MRSSFVLMTCSLASLIAGCAVDAGGLPFTGIEGPDGSTEVTDAFAPPDLPLPDLPPPPDLCVDGPDGCDGLDSDCDGTVDEDFAVGPCDGDGDGCEDGVASCESGDLSCADDAPAAGDGCDAGDADFEPEGTWVCEADRLVCEGDCTPTEEVCNRRDDDCDGAVDEEGCVTSDDDDCVGHLTGNSVYLFCEDSVDWDEAYEECEALGYRLASMRTIAERDFLRMHAGSSGWYVAGRTEADPEQVAEWTWRPSGDPVGSDLWAPGEPSGDGPCAELNPLASHLLNDIPCSRNRYFICAALVLP